jgi:unsaturated pyranuronate lyase
MIEQLAGIEEREIMPGFKGRFVHSETMTFAFWHIEKGSLLQEHSHPHEQVAIVQTGSFELTINGSTDVYSKGKIAIIPPNTIHSGRAITECSILDIFSPRREDFM